jgi:S-adenosylmethionine:tRNA ribosyltransferase-isomerase
MADRQGAGLRTSDFDYPLPAELIAQHPVERRGMSRLLIVRRADGSLTDAEFPALLDLIPAGDVVALNTTRVRHARFLGTRPSGAPAEVLLLHPGPDDTWIAMGRPGSALRPGKRIDIGPGAWIETVAVLDDGLRQVRFGGIEAAAAISRFGRLPLPPYITRNPDVADETRYQTVYAEREASVAAPTAGLHFTDDHLAGLAGRGVTLSRLELEVGPGTFKPVETEQPAQHPMHEEQFDIPGQAAAEINAAHRHDASVWAVGTTVVRALESAVDEQGELRSGPGATRLLITPGYRFRMVDRLLTNFHLPRSTLLMLVAAFAGYDLIMAAYRHAVEQRYRFYSYGDAMLIL